MRILFLTHYFPPEVNAPASRTFEHCRAWAEAGHHVTVVTCVPNHPQGKVYAGYKNRFYSIESFEGIRVIRVLTYVTANEGFLRRTFNYIFYMIMAVAVSPFLGRPDVILATSPQFFCAYAGFLVSRIRRVPWVLEIRDLWPETIITVGAIKNNTILSFLGKMEKFIYQTADFIVSVTDSFVSHIENRGGCGKVAVIKNSADLGLFGTELSNAGLRQQYGLEGRFVAGYVGTHGMCHGLDTLLDAAQKLAHRPDIAFLMVGDGAEKKRLKARRDELGLTNVIMLDQQPKEMMPRIWSVCDLSLVLLRKTELFTKVIPSKIFESMAMGKPIVLGVRGESLELVEAANAGIGIEPENADELAAAICRLADDRALYQRMAASGQAYVCENFDRRKLAAQFLDLLEGVVAKRRLSPSALAKAERPL